MPRKIDFSSHQVAEVKQWMEQENVSYIEIARRLGICRDGGKRLALSIDPEYKGNQCHKGYGKQPNKKPAMELIKSCTTCGAKKIQRLVEEGYRERKCECCGLSEWLGYPIPLELHHKDFNHWNNEYNNLEILCPTCHQLRHIIAN